MSNANLENKKAVVEEIKEKLSKAKSVVFVDFKGINVTQDTALRAEMRKDNSEYKVYKNRLIAKAFSELGIAGADEYLHGTTSVAFSYNSEVAVAKLIGDFRKENENINVKFGMLDGKIIDAEFVNKLSKIPSREVLLTQLVGMLQAPIRNLAVVLNAVAGKETK